MIGSVFKDTITLCHVLKSKSAQHQQANAMSSTQTKNLFEIFVTVQCRSRGHKMLNHEIEIELGNKLATLTTE